MLWVNEGYLQYLAQFGGNKSGKSAFSQASAKMSSVVNKFKASITLLLLSRKSFKTEIWIKLKHKSFNQIPHFFHCLSISMS